MIPVEDIMGTVGAVLYKPLYKIEFSLVCSIA